MNGQLCTLPNNTSVFVLAAGKGIGEHLRPNVSDIYVICTSGPYRVAPPRDCQVKIVWTMFYLALRDANKVLNPVGS
jgi:hypothetical protein